MLTFCKRKFLLNRNFSMNMKIELQRQHFQQKKLFLIEFCEILFLFVLQTTKVLSDKLLKVQFATCLKLKHDATCRFQIKVDKLCDRTEVLFV